MNAHVENIRAFLADNGLDAFLVKSKVMKRYLGTLTGSGCKVLITPNAGYLICDGRYLVEAQEREHDLTLRVHAQGTSFLEPLAEVLGTLYDFEATGYPQAVGVAVAVACLACAVAYFVVVPWLVWPGQTPGKRVAKLRVVGPGDATVGLGRLLVRQVLVGLVLEGSGFVAARYLRELAVLITRVDVNFYWEWAGLVITAVSAVLAFALPAHRALHDYVAGTRVVPAEGHPLAA